MSVVTCIALVGCSTDSATSTTPATPAAAVSPSSVTVVTPVCVGDPHSHVYNPDRLLLLAACIELTGYVDLENVEPDGDFHVRLHLDPGQNCSGQPCLDADNVSQQAGDLVLEPVCENPISQADAASACQGYHNPLVLPPVGSHVVVMGPFVLDTNHGWNEIHPLESIRVVAESNVSPPATPLPSPTESSAPAQAALTVTITASVYGAVAAATLPGASCTAKAKLPSGRISTAAGLQATVVAGTDGGVSWSYRTTSTTTPGTGTHTVTCTLGGTTVSASAPFTVS